MQNAGSLILKKSLKWLEKLPSTSQWHLQFCWGFSFKQCWRECPDSAFRIFGVVTELNLKMLQQTSRLAHLENEFTQFPLWDNNRRSPGASSGINIRFLYFVYFYCSFIQSVWYVLIKKKYKWRSRKCDLWSKKKKSLQAKSEITKILK